MTIDKFHMSQALPSSFLIHHQICNHSSMTGATSGEGIAYPSGATEFTPVFGGILVTRSYPKFSMYCFLDCCLSFFFSHCIVCPSIYGFWLPLWYLQTLPIWRPLLGFTVKAVRWEISNGINIYVDWPDWNKEYQRTRRTWHWYNVECGSTTTHWWWNIKLRTDHRDH
jgi:hypothetical protein